METSYISRLIFDRKGRYLVGYGDTEVLIMDLEGKEEPKELRIQTDYFEKIYHLRFESCGDQ